MKNSRTAPRRPLVYICSPYRGDTVGNTLRARIYCRFAVDHGAIPIAPHLLFPQFMDDADPEERKTAMFFNKVLLGKCSELWVFGFRITAGMEKEIYWANRYRKTIRFFTEECEEVEAL